MATTSLGGTRLLIIQRQAATSVDHRRRWRWPTAGVAVDLDVQRQPQDHLPFVCTRHRDDHGDGDA
jgi:hypothetical protein